MDTCKKCGREVTVAIHRRTQKPATIDLEPRSEGNIRLHDDGSYTVADTFDRRLSEQNDTPLHRWHWEICQSAAEARAIRETGKPELDALLDVERAYTPAMRHEDYLLDQQL